MAIKYNADEVFEMAIRIEENGAAYYRKAAELKKDKDGVDFLLELAEMEDSHKATFEDMKKSLSEEAKKETTYDPMGELELYLEAMADSHPGEGAPSVTDKLTGDETLREILNTAIGLEKESILFYMGIKDMVPEGLGKDKIDTIISEERSHVATLAQKRREI